MARRALVTGGAGFIGSNFVLSTLAQSDEPIETTFEFVNEPSVIRYTMDGSKPTGSSEPSGPSDDDPER